MNSSFDMSSSRFRTNSTFFFFSSRRRHTRWPRDWSSDVCSSDLIGPADSIETLTEGASSRRNQLLVDLGAELGLGAIDEIGRASCRERGQMYVETGLL